jgi:hypothetical protein
MKASRFFALKNIQGNDSDFHRNRYDGIHFGTHCKRGVYFWGFYLGHNSNCIPEKPEDILIYYIGKEQENVSQRIMQEFTQFIIGGFGTIIHHKWLIDHPFNADIYNKQESDKIGVLDNEVIYKSDGLHVLYNFFYNAEIRPTINWMFERFIFAWVIDNDETKSLIETYHANLPDKTKSEIKTKHIHEDKYKKKIDNKYLTSVESEFHHIAGRNTFGLGPNPPKKFKNTKNKKETPHFNSIDWKENKILKSWFEKVNDKLTNP